MQASEGCLNMGVLKESEACSRTFKVYLAKNINLNEAPTSQKVVKSTPGQELGMGSSRQEVNAKPEHNLIDWSLRACLFQKSPVGCS